MSNKQLHSRLVSEYSSVKGAVNAASRQATRIWNIWLTNRQTGWKEERDTHQFLPAAMWLSESTGWFNSEPEENTTHCFSIQNIAQCSQGLFHSPSRSLAWTRVTNYHQVSYGKNSSGTFGDHTPEDIRQCGKYLPNLLVQDANREE